MDNIKVSVIIPAYNCATYISNAIDSALSQGIDSEIIVINDCSPDNLDEVMLKYSENESVIYLKNKSNLGVAETRNFGVKQAKGSYIAFLDADDIWAQDKLSKQIALIESGKYALCATARELIDENGASLGKIIPVKERITYKELLKHNSINCSSVLLKTDVAKEFPMHSDDSHEDYIMWLEILQKYGEACAVNEPLLKYRLSSSGKSGSKLKSAKMTFKVYRYMGFGILKSLICFCSYAFNGVKKYFFSGKGE